VAAEESADISIGYELVSKSIPVKAKSATATSFDFGQVKKALNETSKV
jgi:hypothetical protein